MQLAKLNAEKASMARQRDEAKAAAAKLQQALSNAERLAAQADKDHTVAVSQVSQPHAQHPLSSSLTALVMGVHFA
jgi:hypothetical protein